MQQNILSLALRKVCIAIATAVCMCLFLIGFAVAYICIFMWKDLSVLYDDVREVIKQTTKL